MYIADYHFHTSWSPDGKHTMEEMIQEAVERGISEICFTDHYELYPGRFQFSYSEYIEEYHRLRELYEGQIVMKLGIEIGLQYKKLDRLRETALRYPFDFIIASSHRVHGVSPFLGDFFIGKKKLDAYREYYEYMLRCIENFDTFQVYGHLDYIIRYGSYEDKGFRYWELEDILDRVLTALIQRGKGIEVNTSHRRGGHPEFHPHRDILRRYWELGGRIVTVGSDAHCREHLGSYIPEAYALLREIGFTHYATFTRGRAEFHPLP